MRCSKSVFRCVYSVKTWVREVLTNVFEWYPDTGTFRCVLTVWADVAD